MTSVQVELLTDKELRDEAIDSLDRALRARRRRMDAMDAHAATSIELEAADSAEFAAQEEMTFWERALAQRGVLTIRDEPEQATERFGEAAAEVAAAIQGVRSMVTPAPLETSLAESAAEAEQRRFTERDR